MPYGLHVCGISLRSNNNASLAEDALEFRVVEKFDARRFVEDQNANDGNPEEALGDALDDSPRSSSRAGSLPVDVPSDGTDEMPLMFVYPKNNSWVSDHTVVCYFSQFSNGTYDKELVPALSIDGRVYKINVKQLVKHKGFYSTAIEGVDTSANGQKNEHKALMYVTRGHRRSPTASPRKTAFVHRSEIKFYTKTNPRFTVHAQVFSTQEAKKLVKLAKKIGFTDATVGESNSGDGSISTSIRRTKVSFLQTKDKRTHWVYARLERLVTSINALNWRFKLGPSVLRNDVSPDRMGAAILNSKLKNPLCRMLETLQVMKYTEKDKGFYDSHIDSGLFTSTAFRKLSVTVQLSNPKDYSGGQLELYTSKKPERMPRERGTAVIFPSYMLHRVTPVTKGTRYSLVAWFRGCESYD
eukprot:g4514.t1